MIAELLTITDAAYGGALPVTTRHVFAQILNGVPVVHAGGGQFTPIANDLNGSWSYQRIRGNVDVQATDLAGDPCQGVRVTVPLRIVALLSRDACLESAEVAMSALRNSAKDAAIATGAFDVRFERVSWALSENAAPEFSPAPQIPTSKALLIIDLSIAVIATQSCITGCDPTDVTCAIIGAASLEKIAECLGDRLAELCGGGGPCDPLNYSLRDTDGNILLSGIEDDPCGADLPLVAPDGTVTRDGLAFGSVLSGGTLNVPSDCPCDPFIINVNGLAAASIEDPCDSSYDFLVVDSNSNQVDVNLNRGTIIIPSLPCLDPDPCPLSVTINGDAFETVADPCDDPTLAISVRQSSGSTEVGSKQGTHWRIGDSEISINGTPVADVQAEDSLNIPVVQGGSPVGSWDGTQWVVPECDTLCDLLGDVLPANVQDEILDCVTTETLYAIEDALVCDLDAEAYIARVQQADGAFLEGGVRDAICDFVVGLKADGLWNDIQASCIMAGARTLAGALIPLKGPAPTNVNFVGADYNRETGLKGDGSTKYLDSGRNNNADGQNDAHRAVCISEQDDTLTSTAYMGAGVADVGSDLLGKSGTPPYNAVVRSRTSAAFTAATSGTGCLGISRSGSANYTLRIAGVDQTVTATSQTPHSDNLFVFARNNSGSPSIPSNGRLTFYSIGGALSLSQLDARVTALMTAINAAI